MSMLVKTWLSCTYTSPRWKLARELAPWLALGLGIGAAIDLATRIWA